MSGYNEIAIPVADAMPVRRSGSSPVDASPDAAPAAGGARRHLFAGLMLWTLIHFTAFCYIVELGPVLRLLVVARYLLWPAILLALMMNVGRQGGTSLGFALAPIMPFFLMGILTGLIGFEPIVSARLVVFWLLGMLAAATTGLEVEGPLFRRALLLLFAFMVGASILFVLVKPEWGISSDNRVGSGGAWRGLFPGKNLFGLIAVYALLLSILATDVRALVRLVVACAAIAALAFANSQGAMLTGVAMGGYVVLVWLLRRMPVSNTARILLLSATILLIAMMIVFGLPLLLELLGRDATLTGRSSVWPQWFARALMQWPTGYGPGSFTELSFVTVDLSAQDASLGAIHTPHNMFIAIFGEVGIFGLVAFVLPMLYFVLIVPFQRFSTNSFLVGAIALTMLVGGISETREVFGLGMNMFLVVASYANYRRNQGGASARMRSAPAVIDDRDGSWSRGGIPALGA